MSLESQARNQVGDPGAELLDRAQSVYDRYGRLALGALAVVAAVVAIAFFMTRSRAASEDQAAGKLAEANILFWQGDYTRSLTIAQQVAEQYGSTPSGIDALRIGGDDLFWNADFKGAAASYKRYLDKSGTGVLADAVRRSYAYSLESSGQYLDAANAYESVVGKFDRESSAEFLAASARCHEALNQPAEAVKRLQRLLDEFGETSYAQTARVHLAELKGSTP